jgi:hypothetical protein
VLRDMSENKTEHPGQMGMTFMDLQRRTIKERAVTTFNLHDFMRRLLSSGTDASSIVKVIQTVLAKPRKNQKDLTHAEKDAFNSVIEKSIADGSYDTIAAIHADMSHNMHGFMGHIGALRFLPWHRVYLYKLEQQLQMYEPGIRIPYWDWANDHVLLSWVYLPPGITRGPDTSWTLAVQSDIDAILSHSDYFGFSDPLEQAHNNVHNWVGGNTMPDPSKSPHDPMFWLHHSNVDRIWAQWQASHPAIMAPLAGPDAVMDPWPQTVSDANNINSFFYYYE